MGTRDFIGSLPDDRRLSSITIPGSHDAGVYQQDAKSMFGIALHKTVCQDKTILEQCQAGSRYFDLRIMKKGNVLQAHHSVAKLAGASGGTLKTMLSDVQTFLRNKESSREFVILRISKSEKPEEIIKEIADTIGESSKTGNRLFTGDVNIAAERLSSLRGKIICVFDSDFKKFLNAAKGYHAFKKMGKEQAGKGLWVCGSFADKAKMTDVVKNAISRLNTHDTHEQTKHLQMTYWTQTTSVAKGLFGNISIEQRAKAVDGGNTQMRKNIELIRGRGVDPQQFAAAEAIRKKLGANAHGYHPFRLEADEFDASKKTRRNKGWAPLSLPNIVMYDFINEQNSADIIALNDPHLRAA